jgi:hypothetical protein
MILAIRYFKNIDNYHLVHEILAFFLDFGTLAAIFVLGMYTGDKEASATFSFHKVIGVFFWILLIVHRNL